MVADRRAIAGALALGYATAVWCGARWAGAAFAPLLAGLTAAFVVALGYTLGRVRGAVIALLVTTALNRYTAELGGASLKPEHIAAPLVALALLPDWRRILARLDLPAVLLLVWLAWSAVGSLLNADVPANSTKLWLMLLLVAFTYFAAVTTARTPGQVLTLARAWLLVGIAVGCYGLLSHLLFQGLNIDLGIQINPVTRDPSIPSTFYEANFFGSAMMMLCLTGYMLLILGTRQRWLAWTAALVGLLGVQVSFTRTAWIALVLGLLFATALHGVRLLRMPRMLGRRSAPLSAELQPLALLLAAVVLGTVLLWVPLRGANDTERQRALLPTPAPTTTVRSGESTPTPRPTALALLRGTPYPGAQWTPVPGQADIAGRVASIRNMSDTSLTVRWMFAKQALRDWRAHPIIGLGIGSFGQRYVNSSNDRAWLTNVGVRVLHDSGVIGFLVYGAALVVLAWRALRIVWWPRVSEIERVALALAVAIATMFLAFMMTEGLQIAWYWFSLGLFAAALRATPRRAVR